MSLSSSDSLTSDEVGLGSSRPRWARSVRACRDYRYEIQLAPSLTVLVRRLSQRIGPRRSLWITTPTVHRLYAQELYDDWSDLRASTAHSGDSQMLVLECSEQEKTAAKILHICEWAQDLDLERASVFVCIGGGVVSDLVTMAASMFRRGIPHIRVPTTMLGLVDAGVGVKGAINHGGRKSSLGCFHPPESVHLCPEFCATLPVRQLRSGMAEVLKVAMARDVKLFEALESRGLSLLAGEEPSALRGIADLVTGAVDGLLEELEPNLFEDQTFVRKMDFGHTFSPALEAASEYSLLHGEAVAIDMSFTTVLGVQLGWLSQRDCERIHLLMRRIGLPTFDARLDQELCQAALREAVRHRGGELLLFVPDGIGSVRCLHDARSLPSETLDGALARWKRIEG